LAIISVGLLALGFHATLELKSEKAKAEENVKLLKEGHPMGGRFSDGAETVDSFWVALFSFMGFTAAICLACFCFVMSRPEASVRDPEG